MKGANKVEVDIAKCICHVEYRNQYTIGEKVEAQKYGKQPWVCEKEKNIQNAQLSEEREFKKET